MQILKSLIKRIARKRLVSTIKKETSIIKKADMCIKLLEGNGKQSGIMETKNLKVPLYYRSSKAFYTEALEISKFLRINNIIDRFRLASWFPIDVDINEWLYLDPAPKINDLQEFYNLILPVIQDILNNVNNNSGQFEYYNRKLFPLMDTFVKISLILVKLK